MTSTSNAVEKTTVKPAEKRRALGRGLDSLLPGPRVVPSEQRIASAPDSDVSQNRRDPSTPLRANVGQAEAAAAVPTRMAEGFTIQAVVEEETRIPHFVQEDKTASDDNISDDNGEEAKPHAAAPAPDLASRGITIQAMAADGPRAPAVKLIPLDCIAENPYQTRYLFDKDALAELAESIKESGVLQPIIVRPAEQEGRYILVLGERRLQASRLAKKETIPAMVRRVSPQQAAEMTLIENLQREDLNCIEQAEAFRVLSKEFNLTQEEIGKRVGMSRESVSNYMRLLRLPEKVMEYLAADRLSFSEARELLGLEDVTKMQEVADVVVGKHMSLEEIETLVAKFNGWPDAQDPAKKPGLGGGARWQDPNVRAAQRELEQLLRLRVRIKDRKGKGKIVIEYHTVDDYERVLGMLKGDNRI